MTTDVLSLPANVCNKICAFADDKSLLQMREVSKCAKELIDLSILNIRHTEIVLFWPMRKGKSKTRIYFHIQSLKEHSFWKMCLISVLKKLENIEWKFKKDQTHIYISMNSTDVRCFLEHLKPNINRAKFEFLRLESTEPNTVRMYTKFFNGKIISHVYCRLGKSSITRAPWIDLIQTVKATAVECCLRDIIKSDSTLDA